MMALRNALWALPFCLLLSVFASGSVISWSTYLGGSGMDNATAVAVDRSGNIYVAGWTDSPNFPASLGRGGGTDAFVAKWSQSGSVLVYCRYLGGSGYDRAYGIAVDSSGNAYVTGQTNSTDFPIVGALQYRLSGSQDAFAVKLDPSGNLLYSTYLGGSGSDSGNAIAVDSSGRAYIVGETTSANFPAWNAFQSNYRGQSDVFVTLLNPPGSQLIYSTYLGGSGDDHGRAVAIDAAGYAYVTGDTTSTDFPTANAVQRVSGGNQDAFVAKLSTDGRSLVYSTYLGGSGGVVGAVESGAAIAVDGTGNAYVAGSTGSLDFPVVNALRPASSGGIDGFLAKLNPAGNRLIYSTYLGGSSIDFLAAVAVDSSGNAFVAGYTASPNFPTVNAAQSRQAGLYDAFLTKVAADDGSIIESTFLGGSQSDSAVALVLDPYGIAYVAGQTLSTDFPLKNPKQQANAGTTDAFVTRISPSPQYDGYHDTATCAAVFGWAWDKSNPNMPVNVDILDGSVLLATVSANQFRQDLLNVGIGDGYHGFYYPVPASLSDGQTHTIRVRISGTEVDLHLTPKSFMCVRFEGFHDLAACTNIAGWAWDRNNPSAPVNVDILDSTTLLATISANQFRLDLFNAGLGDGYHAFNYSPPLSVRDGQPHSIRVRVSPAGPDLFFTPRTITCAKPMGFLDMANCEWIAGWAWDPNAPNTPVTVDILDGVTLLATVPANGYRPDLRAAGLGDGYHIFSYALPAGLRDGKTHTIRVRISQTAIDLYQSPRSFACSP